MPPQQDTIQPTSQATGLSEDVIALLQGQIAQLGSGGFASPLQRQGGTAIQQFLQANAAPADQSQLIQSLENVFKDTTSQRLAQATEEFSGVGNRFSSGAALGLSRGAGEQANQQNLLLDLIIRGQENIRQQNLLTGGQALQAFDINQLAQALSLAPAGIFGTQTILTPNPIVQGLQAGAGIAGAAAGGIPGLAAGFPGGAPASTGAQGGAFGPGGGFSAPAFLGPIELGGGQ